jgi:hypothetical protein
MMDEDKEKTAFVTPRGGVYQFTTMPFGFCNAASTFERIIEKILAGLQWQIAVLYLEGIFYCLLIQLPVAHAHTPTTVLLLHYDYL